MRVYADDKSKEPKHVRLAKNCPRTPTPRMPSNQYIDFIYDGNLGECMFILDYNVETLSVTIVEMDSGIAYIGNVSQDSPVMYQDLPIGNYCISCITDEGDMYEGKFHIQ